MPEFLSFTNLLQLPYFTLKTMKMSFYYRNAFNGWTRRQDRVSPKFIVDVNYCKGSSCDTNHLMSFDTYTFNKGPPIYTQRDLGLPFEGRLVL